MNNPEAPHVKTVVNKIEILLKEGKLAKARMTLLDFICNTFNSNNRSVLINKNTNVETCTYSSDKHFGCAIGMFINYETALHIDKVSPNTTVTQLCRNHNIGDTVPKFLVNLGLDFLNELQILHDNQDNWNENGLTEEYGVIRKNHIINEFKLNEKE